MNLRMNKHERLVLLDRILSHTVRTMCRKINCTRMYLMYSTREANKWIYRS